MNVQFTWVFINTEQPEIMNKATQIPTLLDTVCRILNDNTGVAADWRLATPADPADVIIMLKLPHGPINLAAEVKPHLTTQTLLATTIYRNVVKADDEKAANQQQPLIVARYINPNIAQQLRALEINYLDAAGNAFIRDPALTIDIQGKRMEPEPEKIRNLGAKPLQLVALTLANPDYLNKTAREQAAAAGIALGTVPGTIQEMETRGLVRRVGTNKFAFDNFDQTLELWTRGYAEILRRKLFQKRYRLAPGFYLKDLAKHLENMGITEVLVGGETAAAAYTDYLEPAGATLHVFDQMKQLPPQLLAPDARGNIDVLKGFGHEAALWEGNRKGLIHPVLVYAELLAIGEDDRRLLETADQLRQQLLETAGMPT